ncbi:uncharacterized protein LOC141614353 [Silene latifolia]|uniref:uncharacterized protein LOC141614353 n=1 Tax=Silene latifolia TaxID=37657 RepID=UPI003D76FA0B
MGDGVRWPRPPIEGQAWKKDSKKKCEFHRNIGHTMEDCYTLRREIRRLYNQGDLSHLLSRGGKQQDKQQRDTLPKLRAIGQKPLAESPTATYPLIAFDEEDVHDSQEHHDTLIITLSMANCTVRKVLLDTGSSVNLIMLKTKENMGFSEKDL